jgi:hypothetical protein
MMQTSKYVLMQVAVPSQKEASAIAQAADLFLLPLAGAGS